VIDSNPKEGTQLARDTVVALVVSQGARPVQLPDLVGKPAEEAERIVKELGLKAEVTEREVDEDDQRGRVLAQNPPAGDVQPGSTVRIEIGEGRAQVEVPDLQGESFNDARDKLRELGLDIRRIGRGSRVIAQVPGAGAKVEPGTTVNVLVAGNDDN
jgi:serine/threonine-protein kinase